MTGVIVLLTTFALVLWLVLYMRAQKPITDLQQLIHQERYEDAIRAADLRLGQAGGDTAALLHRAEAAKLLGRFAEAVATYRRLLKIDPHDAAATEGLALSLAHQKVELETAEKLMETVIQSHPEIQEFQALSHTFVLWQAGKRERALEIFDDSVVLLQTRFQDDYTDPDPMLAETLYLFAVMSEAAGDVERGRELREKVRRWAPGSVFAEMSRDALRAPGLTPTL